MVTGQEPDGEVLRLGFDAYLSKPVEGDTLRAAVARLLGRQQYNQKIEEYLSVTSRLAGLDIESLDNGGRESYHELARRREVLEDEIDLLAAGSGRLDVEVEFHQFHTAAEGDSEPTDRLNRGSAFLTQKGGLFAFSLAVVIATAAVIAMIAL